MTGIKPYGVDVRASTAPAPVSAQVACADRTRFSCVAVADVIAATLAARDSHVGEAQRADLEAARRRLDGDA